MEENNSKASRVMAYQKLLGQEIISPVRGEYYSYASVFTYQFPIYAMMSCSANKARSINDAFCLGADLNAFFHFDKTSLKIISIGIANSLGLFGQEKKLEFFGHTWFIITDFSTAEFHKMRSDGDVINIMFVYPEIFFHKQEVVALHEGLVVAFMTGDNRYGMLAVEEITPFSVLVEACHMLL